MKKPFNARLTNQTISQIKTLAEGWGASQADVIAVAIDRLFEKEIEMGILEKYMGKTMKVDSPEYRAWLKAASDEAWKEEVLAQKEEYEANHDEQKTSS